MSFEIESFDEISESKIRAALEVIRPSIPPSPLEKIGGLWTKQENLNPTGAFKVRGGLIYFHWLKNHFPEVSETIAATRGNHGQSVAFAASRSGIRCRIVVPQGNSPLKNQAMRSLGADLVEHGRDFAEALEFAQNESANSGKHFVPSFDWKLVLGVATYGYELFSSQPDLKKVYVPVGLGSGICGTIAAKRALNCHTEVIGVVAENAPAYSDSFQNRRVIERTEIPDTVADGVACRIPVAESVEIINRHASDVVTVPESNIKTAMRELSEMTGAPVEGAGAIAYAAWKKEPSENAAVIISGGNVDTKS